MGTLYQHYLPGDGVVVMGRWLLYRGGNIIPALFTWGWGGCNGHTYVFTSYLSVKVVIIECYHLRHM